jgi:hypothetical protein
MVPPKQIIPEYEEREQIYSTPSLRFIAGYEFEMS